MAALSTAERNRVARIYSRKVYRSSTANVNHDDIVAAVGALDDAFEGLPTALPNQLQSVALNMNAVLPLPYRTTATTEQKSTLLAVWVSVKYGELPTGGE